MCLFLYYKPIMRITIYFCIQFISFQTDRKISTDIHKVYNWMKEHRFIFLYRQSCFETYRHGNKTVPNLFLKYVFHCVCMCRVDGVYELIRRYERTLEPSNKSSVWSNVPSMIRGSACLSFTCRLYKHTAVTTNIKKATVPHGKPTANP